MDISVRLSLTLLLDIIIIIIITIILMQFFFFLLQVIFIFFLVRFNFVLIKYVSIKLVLTTVLIYYASIRSIEFLLIWPAV